LRGRNYRRPVGQPFTRQKYIRGSPAPKISKFNMGGPPSNFSRIVNLVSQERVQIRHNALESCRVAANKLLLDKYGDTGYRLTLTPYPHIILRENKMIATAGADRLQEGMRRSFGKPTGRAARVNQGQTILIAYVNSEGIDTAKQALEVGGSKLPVRTRVIVEPLAAAEVPVEA